MSLKYVLIDYKWASVQIMAHCCQATIPDPNQVIDKVARQYNDVIMSAMASQITDVSFVCLTVCSGADQRRHQSSASLTFLRGIHRWTVDSPHKASNVENVFIWWRHHGRLWRHQATMSFNMHVFPRKIAAIFVFGWNTKRKSILWGHCWTKSFKVSCPFPHDFIPSHRFVCVWLKM